ncbi:TetR/AcrR family transcriptional regulator [Mycobacterium hodleri]|nr:TetR/AcrR family transcriptional regulator [Mycolicibacterium hodleri]
MQDKRDRIFDAAANLFAEHGYEAVTTQQISERADIAAGTLFRYASSKGDLLLMVYNRQFRAAIDTGRQASLFCTDPADAVFAMTAPIVRAAGADPENTVLYQRELLFGPPSVGYRADGLALVVELEEAIAERLSTAIIPAFDGTIVKVAAMRAARSVFAVLHLLVAQPATGAHDGADPVGELKAQVGQIVAGFFASIDARE